MGPVSVPEGNICAQPKVESQVSIPSIPESSYFKAAMAPQSSQHSAGNCMLGLMKSHCYLKVFPVCEYTSNCGDACAYPESYFYAISSIHIYIYVIQ